MTRRAVIAEKYIEKAIGDFLFYSGLCFYKQNTRGYLKGSVMKDVTGNKVVFGKFIRDTNPYAYTGLPDYAVIYRGFHCGLEVKTSAGTQSDNQIEFEKYLKEKGQAFYYVVRNLEDAQHAIEEFKSKVDALYRSANL